MSDEKIEVEWIATAQQMLNVIGKIDAKIERQEKLMQKLSDTSKKGVKETAGSFNALEKELKDNEAALKRMAIGTKAFEDQRKKVDQLRTSLKGAKGELTQLGGGIGASLSGAVGKIGALAAGMVSFQIVTTAVTAELEKIRELKLGAAATTRTFEQALSDLSLNIENKDMPTARAMILDNAPKLGVTQEGLADLLGVAISAGAKDLEDAMNLTASALKLTVGDAQKSRVLVGSTLDIASLGKTTNYEGALGQLLQTQRQVRSTNAGEFGANIGPGLAAATTTGVHQQGVSTERAFEIASVISQVIKDPTGSNTATTMRQLFTRMDSFTPERSKKLDDGGTARVSKQAIDEFKNSDNFDARLEMMRKDEGLRLQFLETQRESIGKTAVRELISGSELAKGFEDKAKAGITGFDDAKLFYAEKERMLVGETAQLAVERKAQANIAVAEVSGTRDLEGTVLKIVEDTIAKVNLSGLDYDTSAKLRNQMRVDNALGVNPVESGINVLEEAKGRRSAFGIIPAGGSVSQEDKDLINRQIDALRALEQAMLQIRPAGAAPPAQQAPPQRAPAPAVRPREASLPGATVP